MSTSWSSRLGELSGTVLERANIVVEKTLVEMEASAKAHTPPRVDTGQMLNGWEHRMTGPAEGELRNPVEHAIYNEFGTRHMAPHPMAQPAADEARPGFEQALKEVFE